MDKGDRATAPSVAVDRHLGARARANVVYHGVDAR